jgi:magnesium transporter
MNPAIPTFGSKRHVRVVLSTTALLSFMSVWKATALVMAEVGVGLFFAVGVTRSFVGDAAPWFVLAACGLAVIVRAVDIESWAFLIPGGLIGRAERAYGRRASSVATAVMLTERILLVALCCVLCAQYAASVIGSWVVEWSVTARLTAQEIVTAGAIVLIGLLWTRSRLRVYLSSSSLARAIWVGVAILYALLIVVTIATLRHQLPILSTSLQLPWASISSVTIPGAALQVLVGIGLVLPLLGGGGSLGRTAQEFAAPRVQSVRRTAFYVLLFTGVLAALSAFLFVAVVPRDQALLWSQTPLSALAQFATLPPWLLALLAVAVPIAALFILIPAAHNAMEDTEQILRRLAVQGLFPSDIITPVNITTASAVLITLVSGAQVAWLGRAYGMSIAVALLLRIAVNARLRNIEKEPQPFRAPVIGIAFLAVVVVLGALAALVSGDVPSISALGLISILGALLASARRSAASPVTVEENPFELSTAGEVSLGHVEARPGNVLVAVRHPDSLAHLVTALKNAGDRDIVAVAVRVIGVDIDDESDATSTRDERYLFAQIVALTERYAHPIRLLIVPARNVFDGVIAVALRLQSSEVYVGESDTLSAADQARLLGEAWERAEKTGEQKLRLVIHHHSGRTDAFHLGAHPPELSPHDLDLIHQVWLDAVKAIGPHVHHHDIVRAALTQMEQKLTGPERDQALDAIRQVARPADELAAAVRAADYARLRDIVRNRHASEVANLLTDLAIEDQVVAFRILPRKAAATVFEYLSLEQQEVLLKAMAQEDVAALLNSMAPDDRTMFLEELPAAVTRQLLGMLTPKERSVALKLLGYPDGSIGRLMTPHYVSVREQWTIREVLDYIRAHGQDSETLNVVYVIDEQGTLIDDIRIREFLLAPLENRVAELMDRRFVSLKASDDQKEAIAVFRQYDRSALPVTDTAGVLIGIVTIDDVLDVAEAVATKEIQKIGGSEALDEPYMQIAMPRMVRKRATWLTALFLGEMLTATAMTLFESEISRVVTLALFIPLIISSGGNSGSQAATLVIRALALGEVTLRDWWRIVRREVIAGLSLGAILGTIGFLRIAIWSTFLPTYGPHPILIAVTVALALVGVVLWGSLIGSLLPLLLQRLGFDPATSSAPFVATLVDVTGLVIYFSVALVVLRGTLLQQS